MRTTVGVADARAQLSDIISHAARDGTITVIERYGKPAAAIVPMDVLNALPLEDESPNNGLVENISTMTSRERNQKLIAALRDVAEISKQMRPEESEAVYQALNAPYRESRGRDLER